MELDDELANFIREHKARVAEDKASLEQDPPYMEIKAKPQRTYESTVKENIPPKHFAQAKEENCSVGLPLGVEYERKKQRLRHELRMDYRRYMAQKKHFESGPLIHLDNRTSVKQHLPEDQPGLLCKQQAPSLRDIATLTEDNKWLHRDLCLTEGTSFSPEEEDHSSLALRRRDRMERPVDQVSEDEELELTEGRRDRYTRAEASYEKRQLNKTDGVYVREKRENPVGVARIGRRLRAQTKKEDAEFATGLIIGADDAYEALQRRKECYRRELQEQIAEQHRNKKREKDFELKVAATGANDPEKEPDRIRQFGLGRRKNHQVLVPLATGESKSSSRALLSDGKIGAGERETPPPEQPHVAFQSPLLDYSSALGLGGGGGLSPNSHPAVPTFPRSMDTPRLPLFPPHPPSTLGEGFRSLYGDPQHYYGTRNLDPNMAYFGHMSFPTTGLPIPYWNVPQGGAVASQLDNHSQNSGGSFLEPQIQAIREAATVGLQVGVFPLERPKSSRDGILNYREALKQQIQEQQERKRLQREETERYEAQLEADMKNHQPWGRGGGGAPLRDSTGNLIADLNQMHKLNEEAYSNPEQWQRKAKAAMSYRAEQPDLNKRVSDTVADCSIHDFSDRVSGFTHVHTPQFARGNVFANQPTQQQLQEQDKYKAYLKQQIDEKMRKKAEERERTRMEEEKEEKRLAEQRARIQREYDEEQEKKKRKEIEQKAKNEELIHLAEQRRKEAERKKKQEEEKESSALRRQYERERQARLEEAVYLQIHREPSPPIPTLQKKHGPHLRTSRPPTVASQHSTAPLSERSLSGLQSPPVPARRNQLRAAGEHCDVFNELSVLRRQLRSEQKRLEGRLQQGDWEVLDSPVGDRHRDRPLVDVFDMARLRLQAPVRRRSSRNMEPRNLLRIHNSLQFKNADGGLIGFSDAPKLEEVGGSSQKRQNYKEPYSQFSNQRSTVHDDYFDLPPPPQQNFPRNVTGGFARGSLLESESAFIDPLGDGFPVAHMSDLEKIPQLSARERRRLAKQSQHPQECTAFSQYTDYHDGCSTPTDNRLQLEAETRREGRDQDGTGRLRALGHRGNTTGPVDLSDDNSSPSRFPVHNLNHQNSLGTVATDPWMRPGTSETFASVDLPSGRERLTT